MVMVVKRSDNVSINLDSHIKRSIERSQNIDISLYARGTCEEILVLTLMFV